MPLDTTPSPGDRAPDFRMEVTEKLAGLLDSDAWKKGKTWISIAIIEALSFVVDKVLWLGAKIGGTLALAIANGEDRNQEAFGELAAVALNDMFGVSVNPASMNNRGNRGARVDASHQIGDMMLRAFSGQADSGGGAALEPSDAPAKAFLSTMAQMALEGWLEGWIVEACTLGQLETFGDLDDTISHVLGLGRASAAVHGPLVKNLIVTPLEWKIHKTYRPNLLSPSQVAAEFAAGRWTEEVCREELARQGWHHDRQSTFLNAARKTPSLDQMVQLRRFGAMSDDDIMRALRNDGYDELAAAQVLAAKTDAALETIERSSIGAIQRAYVNRNISLSTMASMIGAIVSDRSEAAYYVTAASAEHDVNIKSLSPAEAKACVKQGVLAVSDYRAALRNDGYTEDAVLSLELLLRAELDEAADREADRIAAEAERAAEKAARLAAQEARRAEVEAQRALHRRGSLSDLERAVVRGLIPIRRYIDVLAPQYDGDTVSILVGLVEAERVAYLEQQKRADDARKRALIRNIDVGALEQAVMQHVITVNDFRSRLDGMGFPAADANVLTATLAARLADATAAAAKRAEAEAAAKVKSIDLGRYERLVTRGARSLVQYRTLLASLGFDDASQAAMVELLAGEIADAAAARQARLVAAALADVKGVTLEQMRRAVILTAKTEADYQQYLVVNKYTADAQVVLMAELRADVADAEDARRRRQEADQARDRRLIPLGTVARAARLGLILPGVYQRRLVTDGYSPEDVEIDMTLLTFEIAETAAARLKRDQPPPTPDPKGLTLEQLSRAVKAGLSTLDDYQARAFALGYSPEAVSTIVQMLQLELEALADAQRRRDELVGDPTREVSVSQLEQAVKAGLITVDSYVAQLRTLGYGEDVAALLAALLETKLAATVAG